jgi:thiol peroxidase
MPAVTLKGNAVTLSGSEVKVGQSAPDFKLQKADLGDYTLASSAGKTRIIASVPSLDTPVCDLETKRFNEEAAKLSNVEVVCVSMDLPFGQKRWCGASSVDKVVCVSDHRDGSFGKNYGVLISGGPLDRVLCRAIFVVGTDNKVKHVEYVKEITEHPNYEAALAAAK